MGYKSILTNQKTSLKKEFKNGDCLALEFDNIFNNSTKTTSLLAGVLPFYKNFNSLKETRMISDHIPNLVGIFAKLKP